MHWKLSVEAGSEQIRTVCNWVQSVLDSTVPETLRFEIELVAGEVMANIVNHALVSLGKQSVQISLKFSKKSITLIFVDPGQPTLYEHFGKGREHFRPVLPSADKESGRGLFIVNSLASTVNFRRLGGRNVTVITFSNAVSR